VEHAERRELRHRLNEAVGMLPTMQQTCFRLCLVEGLSSAEAAGATGLAESTVRVHVFRARRALQEYLTAWRDEMEGA
jgi:RNA polymerase sigma-70 factor (ECF subfamily)